MFQAGSELRIRGFSLVEMLVVMVLLGIMATAATSGMGSLIQGARVRSAAQDLFYSLLLARSEAVKRNADVTVTPIDGDWVNGWAVQAGTEDIQRQKQFRDLSFNVAPDDVTFTRNGRLPPGVASPDFEIEASSHVGTVTRCISLDMAGRPRNSRGGCP